MLPDASWQSSPEVLGALAEVDRVLQKMDEDSNDSDDAGSADSDLSYGEGPSSSHIKSRPGWYTMADADGEPVRLFDISQVPVGVAVQALFSIELEYREDGYLYMLGRLRAPLQFL